MFDSLFGLLSYDLGIDLGTTHVFVLVKGKGIVIREPSVVARQRKSKQILAIGTEAKKMLGKTPKTIEALHPLRHGVISDFDATQSMLEYFIKKVHETTGFIPKIPKPKVVIAVPSGVTEVERRAVQEAALSAGARKAYLIEEPMAAAIGVGMPIAEAAGLFICDVGGGTSEIAIISLGGIVLNRSIRLAGDDYDEAIVNYIRLKYSLTIGLPTAEEIKISIGGVFHSRSDKGEKQMVIRGLDLESGLPKSLRINENEMREALSPVANQIVATISELMEETPPELVSDIMNRGIVLCGGSCQLTGFDKLVAETIKMPVWVADDPQTAVVRGCGKLLENEKLLRQVKVTGGLR